MQFFEATTVLGLLLALTEIQYCAFTSPILVTHWECGLNRMSQCFPAQLQPARDFFHTFLQKCQKPWYLNRIPKTSLWTPGKRMGKFLLTNNSQQKMHAHINHAYQDLACVPLVEEVPLKWSNLNTTWNLVFIKNLRHGAASLGRP